jgi:hypothetical protein
VLTNSDGAPCRYDTGLAPLEFDSRGAPYGGGYEEGHGQEGDGDMDASGMEFDSIFGAMEGEGAFDPLY